MKAVILKENGGPEVLEFVENFPEPVLKPNEVLVRISATSLNNVDLILRRGYPGLKLNFPHILGGDIAGEVYAIGEEVTNVRIGDKVVAYPIVLPEQRNPRYKDFEHLNDGWRFFGMHINGSYSEFIALPSENLIVLPDNVNIDEAATLPIAGLTAYQCIYKIAQMKEGDIFFFWGGASGLGILAIQLAKLAGVSVITTVGKDFKKEIVKSYGADFVFNHFNDDVATEVRKLYPNGVDYVLDFVGTSTFDTSLSLLRKNGKMMVCGIMTGNQVMFNFQQFYLRHLNLSGFYLGSFNSFKELVELFVSNKIKPRIDNVFRLKDARDSHSYMELGQHIGKIVLKVD
ncbi:MAG: zinc-binding dehydrogenase [Ignavibacteria bacterium]|nr:zinc-binding dehydrogenase [Ignavibacteria bacterium]